MWNYTNVSEDRAASICTSLHPEEGDRNVLRNDDILSHRYMGSKPRREHEIHLREYLKSLVKRKFENVGSSARRAAPLTTRYAIRLKLPVSESGISSPKKGVRIFISSRRLV